jgi:dTDP-4-dehydrorhamnose 3,5-epimerase-like enzyme|tara:strand:- start:10301 stop:10906 length:606 start_codon:yes stop_codon:yes gene_type:complete
MDIETLDTAYQGDKDFFWLCYNGRIPDYWISKDKYADYNKFLELFDNPPKSHVDYGGAIIQYNDDDFSYPYNVDQQGIYLEWIKKSIEKFQFKNVKFKKCWWLTYPENTFSGLHTHEDRGQRIMTCVMFLNTISVSTLTPLNGKLKAITMNPVTGELVSDMIKCIAGDVVVMDGKVYHGVYPTLEERKVFVVDFTYDVELN